MGLKLDEWDKGYLTGWVITVLAVFLGMMLAGCVSKVTVSPADRDAHNQTWRYDCCDPGLGAGDKEMCDMAIKNPDHILKDTDGNLYIYTWSDCEIGKEPWRKFN